MAGIIRIFVSGYDLVLTDFYESFFEYRSNITYSDSISNKSLIELLNFKIQKPKYTKSISSY